MKKAEPWFCDAMAEGIQQLMLVGFEGQPAGELLEGTVIAWCNSLWPTAAWERGLDLVRIKAAFRGLLAASERWPVPSAFKKQLPPRPEPLRLPRLMSDEKRTANLLRLKTIAAEVVLKSNRENSHG